MTTGAGSRVPSPSGPNAMGRWLGRYELLHEIATGGMATVYLGRARGVAGFERVVAIKCCHPHLRHDEDFATMFLDEARLAARIHHPNVVSTLDVGDDESLYLVMEYIEGDRLSGLIKAASRKGQTVPLNIAARLMVDVLSGLHAAHELEDAQGNPLQIVHRDVSPQNVLVGIDGVARITDFGIAKAEARATVTRDGQVKGKMSYMAPEQLASSKVTRRADIYAAGVVFWETLTGRRLFRAETDVETLNMVLHGVVPKPSKVVAELPEELDAIVARALERDPEKRYETAADFAEALENATFKLATTRAVANYINEMLAETLVARRELVRKLDEGGALPPEHSLVRAAGGTSTNNSLHVAMMSSPMLTPAGGNPAAITAPEVPAVKARSNKSAAGAVLLLLLVVLVTFGALKLSHQTPPPPPPQTAPVAAPVAAPSPAPAPAPQVVAPAPPVVPTAPVVETPPVAPGPAPEVAAVDPVEPRGGHRHAGRRHGPAAANTATTAAPAAPSAPPPPAAPSQTPPGEFRPGSI
ncbi:MAG: serine/threonine protein kinase [Myxococcales bacterium]|nr:serine/threonine protein kinase [Myxococcales bacterium]